MRSVRPKIRSTEIVLNLNPNGNIVESDWCNYFWKKGLDETPCWSLNVGVEIDTEKSTSIDKFNEIQEGVKNLFNSSNNSTEIDAKHDAVFGIALYCLEILNEMLEGENNLSILSRMGLRTLAECYITLAYLCYQDKAELWQAYRMYGSGQAKLSILKLVDLKDKPKYVDVEVLRVLANEDQ